MQHHIQYIKDTLGNNYLGIKIDQSLVQKYLEDLKSVLSEEDFKVYTDNQKKRDSGGYHITIINVIDYNRLNGELGVDKFINSLEKVLDLEIDDLKLLGLGRSQKNENTSFYVVCQSDKLDTVRESYGLQKHDFHITLGFKWKDVHGVRKNELFKINSQFIKTLKEEFYKKENFNFVKNISNFDLNPDSDIIPISISDTHLKVICGEWIMDIGLMEKDSKLFIFTKYKKTSDILRLPLTEIFRILNQI
jgi:hypothetical protein